jgi:hypothetical protein
MNTRRISHTTLARALAVGAIATSALTGVAAANAAPLDATILNHQVVQHLAPGASAEFQLPYAGNGDVAEIAILPTMGTPNLSVHVLGPDNQPVETYSDNAGLAIKDDLVKGDAGTYTVQVVNDDQTAVDFAIGADEHPLATDAASDSSGNSTDTSTSGDLGTTNS